MSCNYKCVTAEATVLRLTKRNVFCVRRQAVCKQDEGPAESDFGGRILLTWIGNF